MHEQRQGSRPNRHCEPGSPLPQRTHHNICQTVALDVERPVGGHAPDASNVYAVSANPVLDRPFVVGLSCLGKLHVWIFRHWTSSKTKALWSGSWWLVGLLCYQLGTIETWPEGGTRRYRGSLHRGFLLGHGRGPLRCAEDDDRPVASSSRGPPVLIANSIHRPGDRSSQACRCLEKSPPHGTRGGFRLGVLDPRGRDFSWRTLPRRGCKPGPVKKLTCSRLRQRWWPPSSVHAPPRPRSWQWGPNQRHGERWSGNPFVWEKTLRTSQRQSNEGSSHCHKSFWPLVLCGLWVSLPADCKRSGSRPVKGWANNSLHRRSPLRSQMQFKLQQNWTSSWKRGAAAASRVGWT